MAKVLADVLSHVSEDSNHVADDFYHVAEDLSQRFQPTILTITQQQSQAGKQDTR